MMNIETRLLKAVASFAARDETQGALQHVRARQSGDAIYLDATDGFTLCSVEVLAPPEERSADTVYLHWRDVRGIKGREVDLAEVGSRIEVDFPPIESVLGMAPLRHAESTPDACAYHEVDLTFLSRAAKLQAALGAEGAGIHLASEWSQPWRLTIEKAPVRATVLITPRRGGR